MLRRGVDIAELTQEFRVIQELHEIEVSDPFVALVSRRGCDDDFAHSVLDS
mgnify:CR=1 FL=1